MRSKDSEVPSHWNYVELLGAPPSAQSAQSAQPLANDEDGLSLRNDAGLIQILRYGTMARFPPLCPMVSW